MATLCILAGSGWVLKQAWPSEIGWPFAGCIHYALIGCVGIGFASKAGGWKRYERRRVLLLIATGLCLFAAPAAALEIAAGKVPEFTSAAIFCAVPLITVLAANAFGGEELRAQNLIVPALAGLAGAALLFPVGNPGSLRRWLFLGLVVCSCVVVAVASVSMYRLMQGLRVAVAVSMIGTSAAFVLGVYGLSIGWPAMDGSAVAGELLRGAALDLPDVWLVVWLMREMTPARLSARFLLVPLVTVVEGYAVERGALDWRVVLAMGLLCTGGVLLLFKDEPEEIRGLRLR